MLKPIRDAAIAAVQAALPAVKVGPVRTYARNLSELPAAEVSTPQQSIREMDDEGAREHTVTLQVMLMAAGAAPEDTLSALAETVDATIHDDATLAGMVDHWDGLTITFDPGDGAETRPALLRLSFTAVIYTPPI